MKKMRIGIITLAGLLTLGSGALIALNNKSFIKTEANYQNPVSGLFYRITDEKDLKQGDNVVFVSESGYILEDVAGNPGFLCGSQTGVKLTDDKNLVLLTNSKGTIFSTWTGGGLSENSFGFRGDIMVVGERVNGAYIAYNNDQPTGFEYIGYFYGDRTGVSKNANANSSLRISRDEGNDNMIITNVAQGGDLSFTTGYAPRFQRGWGDNVEIYKMINPNDDNFVISIPEDGQPNKLTYYAGEAIDLSGLEIDFRSNHLNGIYRYDENRDLFSYPKYAPSGTGSKTIEVEFLGKSFNITLTIEQKKYTAPRVTSTRADYRGTYMLVDEYGPYPLDTLDPAASLQGKKMDTLEDPETTVYVTDEEEYEQYRLSCVRDATLSGVYHLKRSDDKFLSLTSNPIAFVSGMSSATAVTFEKDYYGIRIISSQNKYLCVDSEEIKFAVNSDSSYGNAVYLHQYELGEAFDTEVDTFLTSFMEKTGVCDYDGATNNITSSIWATLNSEFSHLSLDAQGLFANTTYTHDQEAIGSIEDAADRYDYIVAKYSYTDFMNRKMAGTFEDNYNNSVSPSINNIVNGVNNYAIIIVMIAVISISGLAIFLVLKKKHK